MSYNHLCHIMLVGKKLQIAPILKEGIIQGHVHQEVGIMVVILKSVHHKTY